jgi:hypothetical protein
VKVLNNSYNEEVFDFFTADRGGRHDYVEMGDKLFIAIKKWGEGFIKEANLSPETLIPKPVHIDCINNSSINAIAFIVRNDDFIGIYEGAHHTISALFLYLLSYPGLFVGIGNIGPSDNEQVPEFRLSRLPRSFKDFFGENGIKRVFPKDPKRFQYALFLANLAIQFLIRHEYAHLRHGHVDFLKEFAATPYMVENDSIPIQGLSATDRQALEMDADSYAIVTSLTYALRCVKFREKIEPAYRGYYNTVELALHDLFFAAYCTFRLFSDSNDFSKLTTMTHPPAMQRLYMTVVTIDEFLRKLNETEILEKFKDILINAISYAEYVINCCTGLETDYRLYQIDEIIADPAKEHFNQIMKSWKKLRPELMKHKRCRFIAE